MSASIISEMMPPEQENTIAPNNSAITTRSENSSVHHEQEGSNTNKIKPSLDDNNGIPSQHQTQPATTPSPARFSVLYQSLRPITLKVLINLLSPYINKYMLLPVLIHKIILFFTSYFHA